LCQEIKTSKFLLSVSNEVALRWAIVTEQLVLSSGWHGESSPLQEIAAIDFPGRPGTMLGRPVSIWPAKRRKYSGVSNETE
jgi:hypothetical protein